MILSTSTLPSKGMTTIVKDIDLKPLTYSQILEYNSKPSISKIDRLIRDIELLSDIPGYTSLSAYDLKMLIFTKKWISATFSNSIKIPIEGNIYKVDISDISFKDIDETNLLDITSINMNTGTFPFVVPSVEQLLQVLRYITSRNIPSDIETAMLIASMNTINDVDRVAWSINNSDTAVLAALRDISDQLNNSVRDVTIAIDNKNNVVRNPYKDYNYKEVTVKSDIKIVDINENLTDIFRFIKLNTDTPEKEIINFKGMGN